MAKREMIFKSWDPKLTKDVVDLANKESSNIYQMQFELDDKDLTEDELIGLLDSFSEKGEIYEIPILMNQSYANKNKKVIRAIIDKYLVNEITEIEMINEGSKWYRTKKTIYTTTIKVKNRVFIINLYSEGLLETLDKRLIKKLLKVTKKNNTVLHLECTRCDTQTKVDARVKLNEFNLKTK